MKYAIFGAGAMRTILGAYLSKSGVDIDLISRNKDQYDIIFLLTKQLNNVEVVNGKYHSSWNDLQILPAFYS